MMFPSAFSLSESFPTSALMAAWLKMQCGMSRLTSFRTSIPAPGETTEWMALQVPPVRASQEPSHVGHHLCLLTAQKRILSCPQDEQDDTNLWKPCWSGGRRKRTTNTIRIRKMIVSTTTTITTTSGNDYFNIDQTSNWADWSCLMWWIWCCQVRSKDRSWGSRLRQKPAREMWSCRLFPENDDVDVQGKSRE